MYIYISWIWLWLKMRDTLKFNGRILVGKILKSTIIKASNLEIPIFSVKAYGLANCLQSGAMGFDGPNLWPPGSHLESNHQQRGRNQTTVDFSWFFSWFFHRGSWWVHASHATTENQKDTDSPVPLGLFPFERAFFLPWGPIVEQLGGEVGAILCGWTWLEAKSEAIRHVHHIFCHSKPSWNQHLNNNFWVHSDLSTFRTKSGSFFSPQNPARCFRLQAFWDDHRQLQERGQQKWIHHDTPLMDVWLVLWNMAFVVQKTKKMRDDGMSSESHWRTHWRTPSFFKMVSAPPTRC